MRKLYIFLLALLSISLVSIAQQRDDLMNHPIVGIWDLDRFKIKVSSANKAFEDQLNQTISENETKFMSEMGGSYMVLTEQGTHILIEQKTDLTEFVVKEVILSNYFTSGSLMGIEGKEGVLKGFFNYEILDDYLYLILDKKEARQILEDSDDFNSMEDNTSVDYTFDARVRFKKSARQLTKLKNILLLLVLGFAKK
ncbi:hypothetical protein [Dysgonomonas sp. Marseille-P4361]|uniref:hypothetical protein n=1 Tax=Dysgonomonas sp. Marseille-P4361 TaxID=2161820 RepID=UPI00135A5464|nr:hypothetical protein [Dysgonomonas sp. Marseille-P4361]